MGDSPARAWTGIRGLPMIHTCVFRHPQDNLLDRASRRRGPEAKFTRTFASLYQKRFARVHSGTTRRRTLFVREVPVHGNGIADLLVVSWERGGLGRMALELDRIPAGLTLRAFEVKMSNWRKGLMQAHRYRYFSHAAILVVPRGKLVVVEPHLDLFQSLGVGLWGFDDDTGSITSLYTPRPKRQYIPRRSARAVAAAAYAASL